MRSPQWKRLDLGDVRQGVRKLGGRRKGLRLAGAFGGEEEARIQRFNCGRHLRMRAAAVHVVMAVWIAFIVPVVGVAVVMGAVVMVRVGRGVAEIETGESLQGGGEQAEGGRGGENASDRRRPLDTHRSGVYLEIVPAAAGEFEKEPRSSLASRME